MSDLAQKIRDATRDGSVVNAELKTDQRVLARITDGIYRQPASALRELIANAYDADATRVDVITDPPRFDSISVRDNGNGMSVETLAHVLEHIGGSLKRTPEGAELDVTNSTTDLSPGGRKLIGKIGIGLFSVAQLTSHFQIVTKIRGETSRCVADIVLRPESVDKALETRGEGTKLKTGTVKIWCVPASDHDAHGTEIVLLSVRPQTRDILTSRARWSALKPSPDSVGDNWMPSLSIEPVYHIGGLDFSDKNLIEVPACVPWAKKDKPRERFAKLVEGVRAQTAHSPSPELANVLDNYLTMVWTLANSLPLAYVATHPFDLRKDSNLSMFMLSNSPKGQSVEIKLDEFQSVRQEVDLICPVEFEDTDFSVEIDGLEILRPIVFARAKETTQAINRDLIFFGKAEPNLEKVPEDARGGKLRFEAYLYWTNKLVPKEHNGVLIRVRGASGTLFDSTFMGYQVSEQTRRKQISAEIFVMDGLESALNIDRESFNYANVHYQYISRWLHGAIRQLANRQKQILTAALGARRNAAATDLERKLQKIESDAWLKAGRPDEPTTVVQFIDSKELLDFGRQGDSLFFSNEGTLDKIAGLSNKREVSSENVLRLRAVASVLDAYELLEALSFKKQEELLASIGAIMLAEGNNAS